MSGRRAQRRQSPGVEPGTPHDGRKMGQGAHRVIAALLAAGERRPSAVEILEAVAGDSALEQPNVVYRLAARQVLAAATAIYFRFFVPADEWRFVGSEVSAPGAVFDLLFENPAGELRADELKAARMPGLIDRQRLDEQVAAEVTGGVRVFGVRFAGVRVLILGAPSRSFMVDQDGAHAPIEMGQV
jgi:hypothetical protein